MSSKFFSLVKQSLGISTPASRKVAKERLSIMLVHQRNSELLSNIDMESLQKEVALVVRKYIKLADDRPSHLQGEELAQTRRINFTKSHGGFVCCIVDKSSTENSIAITS